MKKQVIYIFLIMTIINMLVNYCFATDTTGNINVTQTPVSTGESNDISNKQNELKEQKQNLQQSLENSNSQLEIVQSELSDVMQKILELDKQIAESEEKINQYKSEIDSLNSSIDELERNLQQEEEYYYKQKALLENRIVAMYQAGNTTYLDVILNSRGISEFISNYYLISKITKIDIDLLNEINEKKDEIEKQKEALESKKIDSRTKKALYEKENVSLKNIQTVRNNYLSKLTEEEMELQKQIEEYSNQIKEIEKIEQEIINTATANINIENYVGGTMAWPVPGYSTITSKFGMRTHPITGVYKLHTGVDIRAPIGATFIAANDGVVTKACFNNAYGNMVLIDHGGGVSTLYAHGSEIIVTVGQTVKKGDAVLKVGSTGYSTGAHAHFEVRIKGEYVNPLPYIMNSTEPTNTITPTSTIEPIN